MQAYINYLKNVLGVSQVLKSQETGKATPKIMIWIENLNAFSEADRTLLHNMISAMKIPVADLEMRDLSLQTQGNYPIEFDLVLNPDTSKMQTYSPQVLHEQKQLKAQVWTFLQTIMQKYSAIH